MNTVTTVKKIRHLLIALDLLDCSGILSSNFLSNLTKIIILVSLKV